MEEMRGAGTQDLASGQKHLSAWANKFKVVQAENRKNFFVYLKVFSCMPIRIASFFCKYKPQYI